MYPRIYPVMKLRLISNQFGPSSNVFFLLYDNEYFQSYSAHVPVIYSKSYPYGKNKLYINAEWLISSKNKTNLNVNVL